MYISNIKEFHQCLSNTFIKLVVLHMYTNHNQQKEVCKCQIVGKAIKLASWHLTMKRVDKLINYRMVNNMFD